MMAYNDCLVLFNVTHAVKPIICIEVADLYTLIK
jgi:hypothetical protein